MRCLLLAILLRSAFPLFGQADSTRIVDTTAVAPGFIPLPGMAAIPAAESSLSILDASVEKTGQPNLGISVFNTIRGQVPGTYVDPYYQIDSVSWRNNSPMVVIDGVVFNQSIMGYYNLNTFEYSDLRMVLGRNGTIPYGGTGNRGALVLQSKNGEGFTKPMLEFNTYTTYAWQSEGSVSSWFLSNSLAYSQDFGKIDLRVSTNYGSLPPGSGSTAGPTNLSLRVNTGLSLSRLNARLILNTTESLLQSGQGPIALPQNNSTENRSNVLQGNLTLSYQLTDWLTASSQLSRMNVTTDQESFTSNVTRENQNDMGNLLLNVNTRLSPSITFTSSMGAIANHTISKRTGYGQSGSFSSENELNTNSLLGTASFGYQNSFFIGSHVRRDFVNYHFQSEAGNLYSVFSSYNFHKLVDPNGKVLSFGKVRVSYGKNGNTDSFEAGLDAGLLKGRINLMVNYYRNVRQNPPSIIPNDPVTGYTYTYINYPGLDPIVNGLEFMARMKVVGTKKIELTTQLIAAWNSQTLESAWTGGWLNQATWGRFSASMLIDVSAGGYTYGASPYTFGLVDRTYIKFRDISMGYNFPMFSRMKAYLSLSLRNLMLYSASGGDPEINPVTGFNRPNKSLSVNFNLQF